MDYIPLPKDARCGHLKVPFLAKLQYDGLGLENFPQRHGWTDKDLHKADPEELAALLQAWLYFGLMSVFTGTLLRNDDFRRPAAEEGRFEVDSRPFMRLIQQASLNELRILPAGEHRTSLANRSPPLCRQLRLAWTYLEKFERRDCPSSSAAITVFLSIRLLMNSLFRLIGPKSAHFHSKDAEFYHGDVSARHWRPNVRRVFNPYGPPEYQRSPAVRVLMTEMEAAGVCPFTLRQIFTIHDWTIAYYLSRIQYSSSSRHSACSSYECVANNIDKATYMTKHTIDACTCPLVPVPLDKVEDIISRGRIPLIRMMDNTPNLIALSVEEATPDSEYVALSHVWIDGIGNQRENSIHQCQLERIRRLLDAIPETGLSNSVARTLRGSKMKPASNQGFVPAFKQRTVYRSKKDHLFWLDTLCVPVERKDLKLKAINHMDAVYAAAHQVFILDSTLASTIFTNCHYEEALAKIICSAWMSRSWTLQEGTLATDRRVVFADGLFDPTVAPPAIPWTRTPISQRHSSTRDSFHQLRDIILFNANASNKYNFHSSLSNKSSGTLQLLSRSISLTLQRHICTVLGSPDNRPAFQKKNSAGREGGFNRFVHVWNALSWRSTTEKEDILVLVANLLFLRASDLAKINSDAEKVRAILLGLPTIPISILFNAAPRLKPTEDHDDRWLPVQVASSQLFEETDFLAGDGVEATLDSLDGTPGHATRQLSRSNRYCVVADGFDLKVKECDLIAVSFEGLELDSNTFILNIGSSAHFRVTLDRESPDEIDLSCQIMSLILLPRDTTQWLQGDFGEVHGALLHLTQHFETHIPLFLGKNRSTAVRTKYDCPLRISSPVNARSNVSNTAGEASSQFGQISGCVISSDVPTVKITTGKPKHFKPLRRRPAIIDIEEPGDLFFGFQVVTFYAILVILPYMLAKAPFSHLNAGAKASGILACMVAIMPFLQEMLVGIFFWELHRSKGGFNGAEHALVVTVVVAKALQYGGCSLYAALYIFGSSRYHRQRWLKSFDVAWDLTLWQSIWIFIFDEVEAGHSAMVGFFSLLPKLIMVVFRKRKTLLD